MAKPTTCALDRGYDATPFYDALSERRCVPVIRWKSLYRGRASVEREFGRLKHAYGLAPLRTPGLDQVQLHADLTTMLARLSQALVGARAVPLAA